MGDPPASVTSFGCHSIGRLLWAHLFTNGSQAFGGMGWLELICIVKVGAAG